MPKIWLLNKSSLIKRNYHLMVENGGELIISKYNPRLLEAYYKEYMASKSGPLSTKDFEDFLMTKLTDDMIGEVDKGVHIKKCDIKSCYYKPMSTTTGFKNVDEGKLVIKTDKKTFRMKHRYSDSRSINFNDWLK